MAIFLSVPVWIAAEYQYVENSPELWRCVPAQLYGLAASFIGMFLGSLLPNLIQHRQADPAELAKKRSVSAGH